MLVLTRKLRETIFVGDAKLTVVRLEGNRVAIGIEAPADVRVVRGELRTEPAIEQPNARVAAGA